MGHGLRETLAEQANELGDTAVELSAPVVDAVSDAVELSLLRTGAALGALRGGPVPPPIGARRWPWAVAAAVAGAAAGAAVAMLVGRLVGQDAPGAQEPEDVQAVVDRPGDLPAS